MARSVAIIGAGQIGYAAWHLFRDEGWDVRLLARSRPTWLSEEAAGFSSYTAGEDTAPEADIVLDTIAFDEADVARYQPDAVGRLIVVSSASVYCDGQGRTLDEAAQNGFPEFDGPITEDQSVIAPGPQTYSTRKVRMENAASEKFGDRATILRPCAIYGQHSRHPREWWFVKRMLDQRDRIPLIHGGLSQFQTTDANDIAMFAADAAENAIGGIYNIGDERSPTILDIGNAIALHFDHRPEFVTLDSDGLIGRTPWSVPKPFTVSSRKACEAGSYLQAQYNGAVALAILWLKELNPTDWRASFPQLAAYPWDLFDYEAEDRFFDELH